MRNAEVWGGIIFSKLPPTPMAWKRVVLGRRRENEKEEEKRNCGNERATKKEIKAPFFI
jgi:hypothetical protein